MIGYSLCALRIKMIGMLTRVDHILYPTLDSRDMIAYHLDIRQILCGNTVGFRSFEKLLDLVDIIKEQRLVPYGCRNDMVDGEISEHTALDLDFLCIHLPFDLVTRLDFLLG